MTGLLRNPPAGGLVFDASGADMNGCPGMQPREVCGTPTAATSGARTVTVTAQDANRTAGDRDTLTFQVTVLDNPTVAANPAPFPAPPPVVMIRRKPEPAPGALAP